ncbi:MAG: peptide ABC transporter substrate-binding protein [Clostridiales bacterium]|nr:peptide ABC transporter substrate-binding protein [Clostridiales bacterium]
MNKALAITITALLLAGLFSGCGSKGETIRLDIPGPIENLDPLYATDPASRLILANLYEGLIVKGADGNFRPGAAESWEVSPDGMTYTFNLRGDAKWEDGRAVTASHFVFAFQRMFSREAPSPFAGDYAVIEGGEEIIAGSAAPTDLGVFARGERTVEFRLSRPSAVFLGLLADTPAMPCNDAVFAESRGRYGLETRNVFSNGPFMLERWDNSRFIQLIPNRHYSESITAIPERVVFYIGRGDPQGKFLEGKSDIVYLTAASAEEISSGKARLIPVEQTVWSVVINTSRGHLRNPLLRQALAMAVNRDEYAAQLDENFTAAGMFVPRGMVVGGEPYRGDGVDIPPLPFDPDKAAALYNQSLEILGIASVPLTPLQYPDAGGHAAIIGSIKQQWQTRLNFSATTEANPLSQIEERLVSGDYHMMLMPFSPAGENPAVLLGAFRSMSAQNYFGYNSSAFDDILARAAGEETTGQAIILFKAAEETLLRDAVIIPVYYETTYYAVSKKLTGVEILPFSGRILFAGEI